MCTRCSSQCDSPIKFTACNFNVALCFSGLSNLTTCEEAGGSNSLDPMDSIDVEEGENVVLKCRFPAELSAQAKGSTLFWIRTNRRGHDNVAIGEVPYQASYKVNRYFPTFLNLFRKI